MCKTSLHISLFQAQAGQLAVGQAACCKADCTTWPCRKTCKHLYPSPSQEDACICRDRRRDGVRDRNREQDKDRALGRRRSPERRNRAEPGRAARHSRDGPDGDKGRDADTPAAKGGPQRRHSQSPSGDRHPVEVSTCHGFLHCTWCCSQDGLPCRLQQAANSAIMYAML